MAAPTTPPPSGTPHGIDTAHLYALPQLRLRDALGADGTRIASGSADYTARVYSAVTGNDSIVYRDHTLAINSVAWSPDSTQVVSASSDGTAQVWDTVQVNTIATFAGQSRRSMSSAGRHRANASPLAAATSRRRFGTPRRAQASLAIADISCQRGRRGQTRCMRWRGRPMANASPQPAWMARCMSGRARVIPSLRWCDRQPSPGLSATLPCEGRDRATREPPGTSLAPLPFRGGVGGEGRPTTTISTDLL